ncbi:MAG: hypothetical protein HOC71_06625 [Candidatus Latescibacteria bacterium]|jgi:neutral ceramidase|nr:hypothetical protein [Candidatus Latescibacterota bacterium]
MRSRNGVLILYALSVIFLIASHACAEKDILKGENSMNIGFSRIDITPPTGTYLSGQLISLPARGVESNLYASAMYLDDGETSVVFVSCDVLTIPNEMARKIGEEAEAASGIPADNIVVCATHTHSGPNTVDIFGMEADKSYITRYKDGIIEAIQDAKANCVEGTLFIANGQLEGYAFNRRFIMSDGTIETHPLKNDPHIVKPEGPDSKNIFLWYSSNSEGKPLGVAVNYGCHATVMKRDNDMISSDYPGKVTEYITKKLGSDVVALFLQSASGNICQVNPLNSSQNEVGVEWTRIMGEAIGQRAVELIEESKTLSGGKIRLLHETIEIPRRRIDADLVEWANKHTDISTETPTLSDYGSELYGQIKAPAMSLADLFETSFWANFYANEIRTLEKMRASKPVLPLTIKVIAQDNWACVAVPCEVFIELGNEICENSPFEHTSVVGLANGWNGYITTKRAFERKGGYETKEVTSTMLIPEAYDIVLDVVRRMLDKAYNMK